MVASAKTIRLRDATLAPKEFYSYYNLHSAFKGTTWWRLFAKGCNNRGRLGLDA